MYVLRRIDVRSWNHSRRGKACTTYSECVSVALVCQHAISMRHSVTCDLSGSTVFFHILTNSTIFEKKNIEY
jgi:hypothetical protein